MRRSKKPIEWDPEYVYAAKIMVKAIRNLGGTPPQKLLEMAGETK